MSADFAGKKELPTKNRSAFHTDKDGAGTLGRYFLPCVRHLPRKLQERYADRIILIEDCILRIKYDILEPRLTAR